VRRGDEAAAGAGATAQSKKSKKRRAADDDDEEDGGEAAGAGEDAIAVPEEGVDPLDALAGYGGDGDHYIPGGDMYDGPRGTEADLLMLQREFSLAAREVCLAQLHFPPPPPPSSNAIALLAHVQSLMTRRTAWMAAPPWAS